MIFLQLFWNFFLIGCFSFGGGYAMLPLIERQVITEGWMTTEQFREVITVSGMLPGSIGTNAATFIGYQTAGYVGASVATFGMVLPSLVFILILSKVFKRFQDDKITNEIFYGLRPVIVGLIIYSSIKFAISMEITGVLSWKSINFILLSIFAFYLLRFKKIHPIKLIILSGFFGVVLF